LSGSRFEKDSKKCYSKLYPKVTQQSMSVEQIKKKYPEVYWTIWTRGRKAEKERRYWDEVKAILRGEK
jgi:hypothetical protein